MTSEATPAAAVPATAGKRLVRIYARALALLGNERWHAALLAVAGIVIAMVQLAEPILFGRVVDALAKGSAAFPIIGLWAALGLFGIVAGVVVAVLADRLAHRQRLNAVNHAFARAITMPISYHAERGSGSVVRAILAGTDSLFWLWLGFLREQLTAFVGIIMLVPTALAIDWRMTVILVLLAIAYLVLNIFVINKTSTNQDDIEAYHQQLYGRVGDVISNVTILQSYARLAAEIEAMRELSGRVLAAQYPVLNWWGLLAVLTRAAATVTMVAVFALGAVLASRGELTVGEIVSFVAFAGLLIGKLDTLSGFVVRIFQQAPTLDTYFNLIDARSNLEEKTGAPLLQVPGGEVRYENVSYSYGPGNQGVFDLAFTAPPGKMIALVGPTGSGKTTTLALLQRLRPPDTGRILIDGQDTAEVSLDSLRRNIAVVFQEAGLFNRSIAENIAIGRPGATSADIEAAARMAEAHDFIMRKPGGYTFAIGERGASLSGGERQRIAIARAILKDAPILILDEATSALDAETEAKIKRALDAMRKGRTTFVIAHRLSTVANADDILVLDQGRIIERGRFADLVAAKGLFARLVAEGGFTVPRSVDELDN